MLYDANENRLSARNDRTSSAISGSAGCKFRVGGDRHWMPRPRPQVAAELQPLVCDQLRNANASPATAVAAAASRIGLLPRPICLVK